MLDEATLRRLYLDEQRSIRDIAAQLHLPTRSVYDALIRHRIPRRLASFRNVQSGTSSALFDEATLRCWYVEEERSIRAIAELAQVSTRVVYEALLRYGIARRTVGQRSGAITPATRDGRLVDEAVLRRLYEEENLSIEKIASMLACSPSRIRSALIRWGIALRPRGRPSSTV